MHKFLIVIGTRPEAIKLAPVVFALRRSAARVLICVTGQHPDLLPPTLAAFDLRPDYKLSGGPWQAMLPAMQQHIRDVRPDALIVQGDTMSAMVGALAAMLEGVPVHHVEAGLRTGDWFNPFPEEHVRTAIGRLAKLHFAPTSRAKEALLAENAAAHDIYLTGNTVIDALRLIMPAYDTPPPDGIDPNRRLVILTVHRREAEGAGICSILRAAARIANSADIQLLYPVHPRTRGADLTALGQGSRVETVMPIPYAKFLPLLARADLVITDSGGVQEEAAALGTPLICVRSATERPEALQGRRAFLTGTDEEAIVNAANTLLAFDTRAAPSQAFGDGHAAARIAEILTR